MRTALSFLLLAMFSLVAEAQQVQRIEVTDAGIYTAEITGSRPEPGSPTSTFNTISNIKLLESTTTIPAKVGTKFGFDYTAFGQPNGAPINLKIVNHYPAPGLRNPATGNTTMRGEWFRQRKLGTKYYQGYSLDEDWELVPGTWTFEIWQDDRKLAEQSFTVVKP